MKQIEFDEGTGRLEGIDGVLDQVAAAVARQADPIIKGTIIPYVREDTDMQVRVGAAAGKALARELRPFFFVIAGAAAYAAWSYGRRK